MSLFDPVCALILEGDSTTLATSPVGRPTRNNTNVCFRNATSNASVLCYDAGYSANVIYTGYTIVITTNFTWTAGAFYYVTMDSGFASGSVFCRKLFYSI